ncbi:hypothetical protein RCL1_006022 [Eukaryota sp. TZLM3-RCL]
MQFVSEKNGKVAFSPSKLPYLAFQMVTFKSSIYSFPTALIQSHLFKIRRNRISRITSDISPQPDQEASIEVLEPRQTSSDELVPSVPKVQDGFVECLFPAPCFSNCPNIENHKVPESVSSALPSSNPVEQTASVLSQAFKVPSSENVDPYVARYRRVTI